MAHGGLYGALAEASIVVIVVAGVAWIWLRERRRRLRGERRRAEMNETD